MFLVPGLVSLPNLLLLLTTHCRLCSLCALCICLAESSCSESIHRLPRKISGTTVDCADLFNLSPDAKLQKGTAPKTCT
jgi:hypothetical protein